MTRKSHIDRIASVVTLFVTAALLGWLVMMPDSPANYFIAVYATLRLAVSAVRS